jgi:hypothetical protein
MQNESLEGLRKTIKHRIACLRADISTLNLPNTKQFC